MENADGVHPVPGISAYWLVPSNPVAVSGSPAISPATLRCGLLTTAPFATPRLSASDDPLSEKRQYDPGLSPLTALAYIVELAEFVAVTATRMVEPTSALLSVYVVAVAPAMSAQPFPALSQRRHW
jgi:hypothetical protein